MMVAKFLKRVRGFLKCAAWPLAFASITFTVFFWPTLLPAPVPAVTAPCDVAAAVQAHIISSERPSMGPLEREFWRAATTHVARKHGVPIEVYAALVAQESHFRAHVVSHKGARGAAQLMPTWTKDFDPFEIEPNLDKGAEVLAAYIKDAGHLRGGLRRYNGGPKGEQIPATASYADAILARVYLAEKAACQPLKGVE